MGYSIFLFINITVFCHLNFIYSLWKFYRKYIKIILNTLNTVNLGQKEDKLFCSAYKLEENEIFLVILQRTVMGK